MTEIDPPKNFKSLYNCKIELSAEKIYTSSPYAFSYNDIQAMNYMRPVEAENIVTIKLPASEYHKFLRNWNEYMLILEASKTNPHVGEQLHQLLMIATLYS